MPIIHNERKYLQFHLYLTETASTHMDVPYYTRIGTCSRCMTAMALLINEYLLENRCNDGFCEKIGGERFVINEAIVKQNIQHE